MCFFRLKWDTGKKKFATEWFFNIKTLYYIFYEFTNLKDK